MMKIQTKLIRCRQNLLPGPGRQKECIKDYYCHLFSIKLMDPEEQVEQLPQEDFEFDNQPDEQPAEQEPMDDGEYDAGMDEYDEYQEDDYGGGYEDDQMMNEDYGYDMGFDRSKSVENTQTDISGLLHRILEEADQIDKYTAFGRDWALIYYSACGWKKNLCEELIDTEEGHKKLINYTDKFIKDQGVTGVGQCMLCCEADRKIIKNICGEEFCEDCWLGHIKQRLKTYYNDPFPPCINDGCQIKISPSMLFSLGENYPEVKKTFNSVLCRSYATFNDFVKICKGKPGKDCQRVFNINKMLAIIQCDTCGSFVCPRCGDEAHGASFCYDQNNWRKITEDSTQFIEMFNYKTCPNCKEAVERRSGCNSIICSCKQEFCFICGEKWLPNHSSHGDESCYRFKEIMALNKERKAQKQNSKAYFLKIEERKSMLDILQKRQERTSQLKGSLTQILAILRKNYPFYESDISYIEQLCNYQMRALIYLRGWILSFYFRPNELQEMQSTMLKEKTELINDFLFPILQKQVKLHEKEEKDLVVTELDMLTEESKAAFTEKVRQFGKNMSAITDSMDKFMVYE